MPTKEDIEQAIMAVGNLKEVAKGFGINVNSLKIYMDMYDIVPEKLKEPVKKKPKKVKPYIHPTDEHGVRCVYETGKGNVTAQKCFFGGQCGGTDCCDYLLITLKRRPIADAFDTHYCTAYLPVPEKVKKKLKNKMQYDEKRKFLREYLAERNGEDGKSDIVV